MSEHESILAIIHQKNQAPLTLRPERTALLVIDVQWYYQAGTFVRSSSSG